MDRRFFLIASLLLAVLLLACSPVAAGAAGLLVKFRPGVGDATATRVLGAHGARELRRVHGIGVRVVSADARLSFSNCKTLTLALKSATGSSLAGVSGPSVLVLDQTLAAGSYTYVVSGTGRCSFGLTVTSPAP